MLGNSWIDKEYLYSLYIDQKLSTFEIGHKCNVSAPAVRYWLKKWGFNIRDKSESQLGENNHGWVGGEDSWAINKLKQYAIKYKSDIGCSNCGYKRCSNALEFHHINPVHKKFFITRDSINDFNILEEEIKKCIVVCSNCHNEIHYHTPNIKKGRAFLSTWLKLQDIKISSGCCKCSYTNPAGLEFHHRNRQDKLFTIGRTSNFSKPWPLIIDEINKCIVICSNCHKEEEAILRENKSRTKIYTVWNKLA